MRKTVAIILLVAFGVTLFSPQAAARKRMLWEPVKGDQPVQETPPADDNGWVDVESSGGDGGLVSFFDGFSSLRDLVLMRLIGPPTVVTNCSKARSRAGFRRRAQMKSSATLKRRSCRGSHGQTAFRRRS